MSSLRQCRVFISGVTRDVGRARSEIASDLRSHGHFVKVQEDFRQEGGKETTLALLDHYIQSCDAIVHIAGKKSGGFPNAEEAAPFRHMLPPEIDRASYTQFEFHMARFYKKRCTIYIANAAYQPEQETAVSDDDADLQALHLKRLERFNRTGFDSMQELCRRVLREDIFSPEPARKPRNLPFASLGPLFKGREDFLKILHGALSSGSQAAAVTSRALYGLGGIGKTRLAIEYAWAHEAEYSALLFLAAETPERLNASLAALAGPDILDLPEKDAAQDDIKIAAALAWLEHHPGWLMIADNIDDGAAAAAIGTLLPRLHGGHVVITGRMTNFPAGVRKLELGILDSDSATEFLLDRTEDDRERSPDDESQARELAKELGGLALGLEQAGAYIATERTSFTRYLNLWREKRETVLNWFDKTLMSYGHDTGLAAAWATSVERLTPEGRRLLDRLAFFAAEPIPKSLLDVAMPGDDTSTHSAFANLAAYSLVSAARLETQAAIPAFTVHRLVQDFTLRQMPDVRKTEALIEALSWLQTAFKENPADVRNWGTLDPLAPHAAALADHGDRADIAYTTAWLYGQLDILFSAKARFKEAEHASRRALAIDEASHGTDHPTVAVGLNNLAVLLRATNRLAEAEPLYRRALAIDEASHGMDHPTVAIRLNNLAGLLQATNRLAEAEPLYWRAIAIDEASYGTDHPTVAIRLNNLAVLLQDTNRLAEAEPLYRRALAIDEASYGTDHPNVAIRLNNLAGLLQDTNRLAEAEPLYRRAIAINEAGYGTDHPNVAIGLNNLAGLLRATNRLAEAEPLYWRAIAIDEASYGRDHPNVAIGLINLAGLLRNSDRLAEGEPLIRRAIAIDEASYGPNHPEVATDLEHLAALLLETDRAAEAEPLIRRAQAIRDTGQ